VDRNADRAAGYAMPGIFVPGNDPDAIHDAAGEAIARARSGGGPTLLELETTRLEGHFMGDAEGYRPDGEVAALKAKDPIPTYRRRLEDDGFATEDLDHAENAARAAVERAFAFARSAAMPLAQDAFEQVFVTRNPS
jgi:pyruvate dehydrogenase E1 component alpha subunit